MNTIRRGAAGILLLLLSACSSLPPEGGKSGPPEYEGRYAGPRSKSDLPLVSAADIPALVPRWGFLSAGGEVSALAGKIRKPPLEFWALRIELDHPAESRMAEGGAVEGGAAEDGAGEGPRLRIVLGAGESPRPGYVLSTRVSSFVRNKGLVAGINTVPFDPSSAREGEERRLAGAAIADGKSIAPPVSRYDALVFYADGGAAIVNQGELDPADGGILHAAGGFHCLLREGELMDRARQKAGPRYARSAAGLSGGGRTLYLMVINGGLPGRPGATEAETALILKQLGARDVLNLDGGGSSALALRFSTSNADNNADGIVDSFAAGNGGRVRLLNTPVHGFPGRERAVGLCLGVGFFP